MCVHPRERGSLSLHLPLLTREFPWYRWDADRVRRRPESRPHFLRPDQPVDPLAEA
jgi:hypothetical protein